MARGVKTIKADEAIPNGFVTTCTTTLELDDNADLIIDMQPKVKKSLESHKDYADIKCDLKILSELVDEKDCHRINNAIKKADFLILADVSNTATAKEGLCSIFHGYIRNYLSNTLESFIKDVDKLK